MEPVKILLPKKDIECTEELLEEKDRDYDDTWIFWTEEIDESVVNTFIEDHYLFEKIYQGLSSDGQDCFVYSIKSDK